MGEIDGEGMNKGVLVATAIFNSTHKDFTSKNSKHIILTAGEKPVQLPVENDVSVRVKMTIEIKRVDVNFA